MVKTQRLTPEIYYKESRDFQFFGRVYDIIFNYAKTNADLMENFPLSNHTDSKLLDLLARTLGFFPKTEYVNEGLNAVCNVFATLINEKGSVSAIKKLIKTVLNVEGVKSDSGIIVSNSDESPYPLIQIQLPIDVSNPEIKLFEDVLDYIIPAGCLYEIQTTEVLSNTTKGLVYVSGMTENRTLAKEGVKTNVYITKDTTAMESVTIAQTTPAPYVTENPIKGDIRYTKVIGNLEVNNDGE